MKPAAIVILLITILTLSSCSKQTDSVVRIAINPWPGYEYLFLAQQKGFFQQQGLNVEMVAFGSLSDSQRAYVNKRVDGLAATMIEAVQSSVLSESPLKIVLIPDFSNGGDVVIARAPISSPEDLKGKRVGAEVSSLGIYMLHRTLLHGGLGLNDITLVNLEQSASLTAFSEGEIDAYVTYPPYSIDILKLDNTKTIFTSAEIPFDIVDMVAISEEKLKQNPGFVTRLHRVWQQSLDYAAKNPDEANQLMASREGIDVAEFEAVLGDIHILSEAENKEKFSNPGQLQDKVEDVCRVLVDVKAIQTDCSTIPNMIYSGAL